MHLLYLSLAFLALWAVTEAKICPPAPRDPMSGQMRVGPQSEPCDLCDMFFDPTGIFMTDCAPYLTTEYVKKVNENCPKIDEDELTLFFMGIRIACERQGHPGVDALTLNDCPGCDQCKLLFDDASDFTVNCGNHLDADVLADLKTLCEASSCTYADLVVLQKETQKACAHIHKTFVFEPCECNECIDFFQSDSEFMTVCGNSLREGKLHKLRDSCADNMLDTGDLFGFFWDVKEDTCGGTNFEFPLCDCEEKVCFLLFDESTEFFVNCFDKLSKDAQDEEFAACETSRNDADARDKFVEDLENRCVSETGVISFVPDCSNCSQTDLDIVFIIDTSSSIRFAQLQIEKSFVSAVSCAFTIADDRTRIGVVEFGSSVGRTLPIDASNSKSDVTAFVTAVTSCSSGCGTNTAAALDATTTLLTGSVSTGNPRVVVVITDGMSNSASATRTAAGNIPSDVTVFAVGVAGASQSELVTLAASGNGNGMTFFTPDFTGLSMTLRELRDAVCQP